MEARPSGAINEDDFAYVLLGPGLQHTPQTGISGRSAPAKYRAVATACSIGHQYGDDLPLVSAIDLEGAVERKHDAFLIKFRHPDNASVGERHWHAGELLHQGADGILLRHDMKVASYESTSDKFHDRV